MWHDHVIQINVIWCLLLLSGDPLSQYGNIHPRDKQDVAYRLFLAAAALTDGSKAQYIGPTYKSFTVTQTAPQVEIQVEFEESSIGSGLVLHTDAVCPQSIRTLACCVILLFYFILLLLLLAVLFRPFWCNCDGHFFIQLL